MFNIIAQLHSVILLLIVSLVKSCQSYEFCSPFFSAVNRKKLAQGEPKLVTSLVQLMDSQSLKVQCQAALALRNLASDGESLISQTTQWKFE